MPPILLIAGTNRPNSNALKLATLIQSHYTAQNTPSEILSLTDLPPETFLPTTYATKPPAVQALQHRVLAAPGLHIITPEYNGSFPGVLKYFIDMLKFPESFLDKPVAFTGHANGMWGALRAVEHLQQIFSYRNAHLFPDRVFIPNVNAKLTPTGQLTDQDIDARLAKQTAGFAKFITTLNAAK